MKLSKEMRRKRALARFSFQSEVAFNEGNKADGRNVGTYADYLARKNVELAALRG